MDRAQNLAAGSQRYSSLKSLAARYVRWSRRIALIMRGPLRQTWGCRRPATAEAILWVPRTLSGQSLAQLADLI